MSEFENVVLSDRFVELFAKIVLSGKSAEFIALLDESSKHFLGICIYSTHNQKRIVNEMRRQLEQRVTQLSERTNFVNDSSESAERSNL